MPTLQELEDQLAQVLVIANQAKSSLQEAQTATAKAVAEVHRLNNELREAATDDLLAHGFQVRTTNNSLYRYVVVHNTRPTLVSVTDSGDRYLAVSHSHDGTPFNLDWVLGYGLSEATALADASINWRYDHEKRNLALEGIGISS